MYFVPEDTLLAVVTAEALLAVPVRFAVTVAHANVPPVFVRARVFALYVNAVACVSNDAATEPLATFVNRRRNVLALAVFVIVIFDPDPGGPIGPSAPSRSENPRARLGYTPVRDTAGVTAGPLVVTLAVNAGLTAS
jgi:hypothetical protein